MARTSLALAALLALGPLFGAPRASADLLAPRSGKAVTGAIVSESDSEVVFNVYWSRNPGVTNPEHLVRLPRDRIKKLERAPHPEVEVFRRLEAAQATDAEALAAIARYAQEHKLKAHARMAWALVLAVDENHAEALKGIGGRPRWASEKKGNPRLDPALAERLAAYVAAEDPARRRELAGAIQALGFAARSYELERYRRSLLQPKGLQTDRPLAWRNEEHPGAVYTLYVPEAYDPTRPWPLVVGLHGGGADGKAGDEVVGSGPSAMNFYQQQAARRGFLVACPTALSAGWGSKDNEDLVRDVIAEVGLLYHVDTDRIYMTGHSMGGFGTWALGPRMAEDLAAISPMAGGGSGVSRLVSTRTPIFIYHSDDDYVSVESDRAAARQLRESDLDFVYTELPGQGHGFPPSIQVELFDFLGPRRRYDKGAKDAWPRSSFLGKVGKPEELYLGDPEAALRGEVPDLKTWLAWLRLGGGRALVAVTQLAAAKPPDAAAGVAKVLGSPQLPFDARAYAARALGLLGDPAGLPALRKAVALEATREQSLVAQECARALKTLGDAESAGAVAKGLEAWTRYYESKVSGDGMRFSDWARSTAVLVDLVEAWGTLAPGDARPTVLEKALVERVLAPHHQVETSERVPQDPSQTRTALARGIATAYVRARAEANQWDALLRALAYDPKAQATAAALRP